MICTARSPSLTRAFAAALLLAAGCLKGPTHTEHSTVTDAFLINEALAGVAAEVEAGRTRDVLARLAPDFRLQGDGPAEVEEWCRFWQTFDGVLGVSIDQVDIDLPGADDPAKLAADGAQA